MTIKQFKKYLESNNLDENWPETLKSLWYDRKGNWDKAHFIAQRIETVLGSAIHAYLHREEGVLWNADFWYERAGRFRQDIQLEKEWNNLLEETLETM